MPHDVLAQIMEHLSLSDRIRAACVCSAWSKAARQLVHRLRLCSQMPAHLSSQYTACHQLVIGTYADHLHREAMVSLHKAVAGNPGQIRCAATLLVDMVLVLWSQRILHSPGCAFPEQVKDIAKPLNAL